MASKAATPTTSRSLKSPPPPAAASSSSPPLSPTRTASGQPRPRGIHAEMERHTHTRRGSQLSATPSGGAGASLEQRRARRAELRQFYGLKGTDGTVLEGNEAGVGKSGNPLDVDSPAFNAGAYYEDLLAKSTLAELIKVAASYSTDIGKLQGSRHSLVYNHHHQLFAAGDTISKLNSRTPELLGIVTSLQQSFSEISRLADEVAMPEESAENAARWSEEAERLRLMVSAEEPSEKIKGRFESIRVRLEEAAEKGEEAKNALEECRRIVDGLSSEQS